MDLLVGYGSDTDTSTSSKDSSSSAPALPPYPERNSNVISTFDASKNSIGNSLTTTTGPDGTNRTIRSTKGARRATKRGKRLLSLNAVLPPEIFERLTRSTVGGASEHSNIDSSSDEDDNNDGVNEKGERKEKTEKSVLRKPSTGTKGVTIGINSKASDEGLNCLLSDLQNSGPNDSERSSEKKVDQNEKVGFAFMQVSSSVVRKKKNGGKQGGEDVEDIHGSSSSFPGKIEIENIRSNKNDDGTLQNKDQAELAVPLFPNQATDSKRDNSISSRHNFDRKEPTKFLASRGVPRPATERPRIDHSSRPLLPANTSSLIPSIRTQGTFQMGLSNNFKADRKANTELNSITSTYSTNNQCKPDQVHQQEPQKKRSRKELEKRLRTGDFSSFDAENTVVIDQSLPSYTSYDEMSATAHAVASQSNSSNIRAPRLEMYNPKEGSAVIQTELTQKHKSKHQIHSLVMNAASLEAKRTQQGTMGILGTKKGSSSRVDAKKKYGW